MADFQGPGVNWSAFIVEASREFEQRNLYSVESMSLSDMKQHIRFLLVCDVAHRARVMRLEDRITSLLKTLELIREYIGSEDEVTALSIEGQEDVEQKGHGYGAK